MQTIGLNEQELFKALAEEQLIITPNQHLAYVLLNTFFRQYTTKKIHKRPTCLPYETFLTTCYAELIKQQPFIAHPILLDIQHARILWIQNAQKRTALPTSLLDKAFNAWQLCHTWDIPLDSPTFNLTSQTQVFHDLALAYEETLANLQAITPYQIVKYLFKFKLQLPYQRVIFCCFDDFNPQQVTLQKYIEQLSISVTYYDVLSKLDTNNCDNTNTYCLAADDEVTEREAILSWLTQQSKDKPSALIVPNLEQQASLIKRWLQAHFPNTPMYFSLGEPLSEYPIINHALICLSLSTTSISKSHLKILLQSSLLAGHQEELTARHSLALQLPDCESFSLSHTLALLKPTCPLLSSVLENLTPYPQKDSPLNWTKHFINRLKETGLTDVDLHSQTFQTYQRFITLLESFRTLILFAPIYTLQNALQTLTYLTEHTTFQPEQKHDAPIHVLGPFEAAGIRYEAAWFMGLTDQQWPSPGLANPFIPISLQQSHHLPHTDMNQDLLLARKRLHRFQAANKQLIISYPQKTQDVFNRPSIFLKEFPSFSIEHLRKNVLSTQATLQLIEEPLYIPIKTNETISKGTALLGDQAQCPFKAFAAHRLMRKAPNNQTEPLSNQTRGLLLHRALESLWQKIPSQASFLALDEEELKRLVSKSVSNAIQEFSSILINLAPAIQKLEEERLIRLLYSSFNWEATREPFNIDTLEKKYTLTLGPLTFHLRIDRIDKVNNHEKWVTDYKTTCPAPLPWHSPTPLEPQILLYALIDPAIRGLIFHELKKGQSSIKGISALPHPQLNSNKNESWDDLREKWRQYLLLLAQDFYAGYCVARPANEGLCLNCDYQNLCRIDF